MEKIVKDLYEIILERKKDGADGSYTKYLLDKGTEKILKKVGEECTEVIIASMGNSKEDQVSEICDLIYHLLVLAVDKDIALDDIKAELMVRRDKSNNLKSERKEIENL